MAIRTYLRVIFNSEGARPSQVVDRLQNLGFRPITGYYDFVYEWPSKATVREAINFADLIHETLRGLGVFFELTTLSEEEQ